MELFLIYLWLKSTAISILFVGGGVALFVVWGLFWIEGKENSEPSVMKNCVGVFSIALFCTGIVMPSSKDIAILAGASIAIDVAKSPEGEKISKLIRAKANDMIDEELKELGQKK